MVVGGLIGIVATTFWIWIAIMFSDYTKQIYHLVLLVSLAMIVLDGTLHLFPEVFTA